MSVTSDAIVRWGRELGFELVGIARADGLPEAIKAGFGEYLREGRHGGMTFLERTGELRMEAGLFVPGARSVICVGKSYYVGDVPGGGAGVCKVARYAWGRDYHDVMREGLKALAARIREEVGEAVRLRVCVDTAPLLEKAYAMRAGLGWIGRHTLLVNQAYGSWVVLGEIVTDLALEPSEPAMDRCGECRRCLEACPTGALYEGYRLDARRCLSYVTVESTDPVPDEIASRMQGWVFGCDRCQEVCPYNQRARQGVGENTVFGWALDSDKGVLDPALLGCEASSGCSHGQRCGWEGRLGGDERAQRNRELFEQRYAGTPVMRVGWQRLCEIIRRMGDSRGETESGLV